MAHILDSESEKVSKEELNLWEVPPTQVSIQNSDLVSFHPLTALQQNSVGPYEFNVVSNHELLDISHNLLVVQATVTNEDGTNLAWAAATPLVSIINNLGQTFIKQIRAMLNGRLIHDSGPHYAYEVYLANHLSFGEAAKQEQLKVAGYVTERESNHMDSAAGTAFKAKATIINSSGVVEFASPIRGGIFSQPKLLVPQSELRVEITRNSDTFSVLSFEANRAGGAYKVLSYLHFLTTHALCSS